MNLKKEMLILVILILASVLNDGHADTIKVKDLVYIYDLAKSATTTEMYVITKDQRTSRPTKSIPTEITLRTTEETAQAPHKLGARKIEPSPTKQDGNEQFTGALAEEMSVTERKSVQTNPEITMKGRCIKCRVNIFFPIDKHAITNAEKDQIEQYISCLKDIKVRVTGYTCKRGTQRYNEVLAIKRAQGVAEYLVKRGINIAEVVGKGGEYISKVNKNNRRVEIEVIGEKENTEGKQ
jgi:outer membrane protein OmpA-like peptidoglycan-associated protein